MFSTGHIVFLILCTAAVAAGFIYCVKTRPPIKRVLAACLFLALLSELIKVLTMIQIVPIVEPVVQNGDLIYRETGSYTPYLEAEHFPFEDRGLRTRTLLWSARR